MDLGRPRIWEWAAAAAGVVVLVSLFGDWFGRGGEAVSGWGSFVVTDLLLALVALMALAVLVAALTQRVAAVPVALASLTALVGSLAAVVVILRLLFPPGDGDVDRLAWAWVGTLSTIALAAACWAAMRDERPAGRAASAPASVPPRRLPAPSEQAEGGAQPGGASGGAAGAHPGSA